MPTVPQGADFDRVHDVEYETEWLAAAKSEIFDGQRFGQSEMLDQPVCFLYVVCSSESNPLRRLEQMIQNGDMAPSFTRQYNCSIPRFYVLLHDAASTEAGSSEAEVEALFQKMRRLYAVGDSQQTRTFLVRINSRPEDAAAAAAAEGKSPDEIAAELRRHRHKVTDLWNFLGNNAPSDAGGARASHDGLDGDGLEIGSAQSAVGERGALLSEEDVRGLRNFPVEFTQNGLFPALEQFVAELNAGIDKEKKGIKNAWRSWWKKPKAEAVQVGQLQYAHSDIVSRVRTLADLSFIFRDYETAHTMYRMVKEDTKLDKAWNHYAGAVEMVALSLFMLMRTGDAVVREIRERMETAAKYYKIGKASRTAQDQGVGTRYSTRATLLYVGILRSLGTQFGGLAADQCIKAAANEEGLAQAVLYDVAARCFHHASQHMWRKSVTYLLAAGHVYTARHQRHQAIHCYDIAKQLTAGQGWEEIDAHLDFSLGLHLNAIGSHENSIQLFCNLLACGSVPVDRQTRYLQECTTIVQAYAESTPMYEISNLTLPVYDDSSIRVFRPQNAAGAAAVFVVRTARTSSTASSPAVLANARSQIMPLEIDLLPEDEVDAGSGYVDATPSSSQWETLADAMDDELKFLVDEEFDWRKTRFKFAGAGPLNTPRVPEHFTGEPVFLRLKVHNPLDSPVTAEDVTLYGGYARADISPGPSPSHASRPRLGSGVSSRDAALEGDFLEEGFVAEVKSVTLEARSSAWITLWIRPERVGTLHVKGVRWRLQGNPRKVLIRGRREFSLQGKLKQDTRANRAARRRIADLRCQMTVRDQQPWLGVSMPDKPTSVPRGAVVAIPIFLINKGSAAMHQEVLALAESSGILFSRESPDLVDEAAAALSEEVGGPQLIPATGVSGRMFTLTADQPLAQNTDAHFTLWLRATQAGPQRTFRILFRYRAADSGSGSAAEISKNVWRTLEFSFTLDVVTSVSCKASVRAEMTPSPSANATVGNCTGKASVDAPPSYLLNLLTTNRGAERVVVDSLHFVSRSWDCAHLHQFSAELTDQARRNRVAIAPGTESVFHVRLLPREVVDSLSNSQREESKESDGEKPRMIRATAVDVYDRALDEEASAGVSVATLPASNVDGASADSMPALYRRLLLQENAVLYVKRHQKLRAAWQPVWGPPPPPPPVPHVSSASLFHEGEEAGEELHLVALWHTEPAANDEGEKDVRVSPAKSASGSGATKAAHVPRRGMTSLLRIPVRFRMAKTAFQCPLNMGLAYNSHMTLPVDKAGRVGGVVVPVVLRVSNTALPGSPTLHLVVQANNRTADVTDVVLPKTLNTRELAEDQSETKASPEELEREPNQAELGTLYTNSRVFYWVGVTTKKLTLAAGECVSIPFTAFFQQAGTFNLNCFQFVLQPWEGISPEAAKNNVFCFPYQYPITLLPQATTGALDLAETTTTLDSVLGHHVAGPSSNDGLVASDDAVGAVEILLESDEDEDEE
eukprot:INCI17209.6.p1 GENE.INCI17209.6~~INCI17209.6.p1  ORF type:complete len:1596 (-),score=327.37 INCI17209.6:122-4570(-)